MRWRYKQFCSITKDEIEGFPSRLGAGQINRVAEIVGISEKFVQLIHQAYSDSKVNPLKLMEKRVFPWFSAEVVAAFRALFFQQQ